MVVRREKHKSDLRQPLLAKLWWASMPVFIASQGLVAGEGSSSAPEHFWPIHESSQASGYLKSILNYQAPSLVGAQVDPLARKPSDVDGENDIEVDWFITNAPSNQRFQITAEAAKGCLDEQDCRFVPCNDSSNLCRTFLYQQETAKKVSAVASTLCSGGCMQAAPTSWESCNTSAASPWMRQYLADECAAPAASELANVPVFACDSCLNADSGSSYHVIASSERYEASDIEITRPAVSQLSYVPPYLDASGSYGFEVQTAGYVSSIPSVTTETNESCPGCLEGPIPPLLVSGNVSITGMTSGEFGDADKLHLQIVLADQSSAADFRIVDPNRTDTVVRDIPYLLCDGCDVTHGHPTGEDECVAGSCIILLTDSVHLTRQLEPFQSLPSIACADCQLITLSGEHALAQANTLYDWAYPASERVILGIERQEEESLLPIQLVYALEELTYLQEPLEEHTTILARSSAESRSGIWSSAPSPSNIFTDSDCIGAECEHKIAYLTPDHPTAARAAFPGTHYDTIADIDHTNTFASEQLAPTDPTVYCDKDTIGAVTVDIDAAGVLDSASRSFLAIARDRCSNVRNSQGIAQSAPDPRIWNKVEKLSPPTPQLPRQLVETIAAKTAQPVEPKKQQAPDYWSMLDNLVQARQPAYEMGSEVASAVKTDAPLATKVETTITFPGIEPEAIAKEFPGITLENDATFAALLNTMRKDEINPPVSTDPGRLRTEQNSTLSADTSKKSPEERFQGLIAKGSGKPEQPALIEKPNYAQILASATADTFPASQEPPTQATTRLAVLSQKHTEMTPGSLIAEAELPKEEASAVNAEPFSKRQQQAMHLELARLVTDTIATDTIVIADDGEDKVLLATSEPMSPPERSIGQEQFIAANIGQNLALEEQEAADYIENTTKAIRIATQPLGDSSEPTYKPAALQAGGQAVCYPICCEQTTYPQCTIAGETQKQCFDVTQLKQLTASVDPKGIESVNVKVTRRPQEMWSASPGPGSQHVTMEGKVPGGLDIASGRTGVRRGANDGQPQVRELQGGYYYYIGEGPSSTLSTNKDHLQVSGRVTQLPGTSTDVAAEDTRVNLHGKEQVGIREYVGRKGDGTLVALAPSVKGGDYRPDVQQKQVDTSITLTSAQPEGISTAFGRADLRAGKQKYNFVKVVDVTKPSKARSQAGKVSRVSKNIVAEATDKKHRFAVEVTPHSDSSPSMKSLVGPAKQPQPNTAQRSSSFFIDFAHAGEGSIGYEPNSFVSVGAPIYDDYEGYDDEPTGIFVIGSYDDHGNFIEFDEDEESSLAYEDLPIGEPGIDPLSRKNSILGVRREGLLWDGDKPWLDEEESSEITWDDIEDDDHLAEMQPPDKAKETPPSREHPITSREVAENTKREPEVTLQKKNRTTSIVSGSDNQQEPSHISKDSSSYVSDSQVGQPDDEADEANEEGADTALNEWERLRTTPALAPSVKRDLDPRRGLDKTIAQETLFESGVPEPQKPREQKAEEKPKERQVTVIEEEEEPQGLLINYRDILMTEYVKFVSQLTNKNFVFNDDDLQFKITVISEQPTSVDNIMAALLQELRIHGLQVIEQGNNIIIHKSDRTRGPVQVVKEGDKAVPHSQLVTRVFQLDSIQAEKMQEIVTPVMSAQALIQVLPETNNLLITDFTDNVDRIADLIHALDMPTTAYEIGQYVGHNNFIENLIPLAEEIIRPFADKQNMVFVPHLATNSVFIVSSPLLVKRTIGIFEHLDALEGTTKILTLEDLTKGGQALTTPQDRSGEQIQLREQTEQEKAEEIRARLEREASGDRQGGPLDLLPNGQKEVVLPQVVPVPEMTQEEFLAQTKFYIHKLQYRQGDQLQDALTRIGDSLRLSEKASIDLINAINSIQWIESSNSLIVTGTPDALSRVRELIEEVDLPLRQVFLEMLILDTSITDSLTYAVDITSNFKGTQVGAAQGFSGGQPSASGAATPLIGAVDLASAATTTSGVSTATEALVNAATLAAVSTPGYNLGIIGRRILKGGEFFNTMGALVQAVHTDVNSEIVLNPKIIVEDNNEAEIFVGENIAFQTQNVVNNDGTIVSQNFEFRDVGTTLRVRPQIGNNNIITLEIEQEVSSTITTQTGGSSGGNSTGSANISPGPSTATSRTITKVHVPNEFFVVISGMIKEEKKKTRSQIPCLGGLPVIGAAGSRMDNTSAKRNLMIFIRPQIVDTEWDFDDITKTQQNIYKDKGRTKPRWKFEADEGLEFMNLPRINERCECDGWLPGYRDDEAPSCN